MDTMFLTSIGKFFIFSLESLSEELFIPFPFVFLALAVEVELRTPKLFPLPFASIYATYIFKINFNLN